MKLRTRPGVQNYKRRDNTIPDPNTDPGLPPRQFALHHRRNDHPSVFGVHVSPEVKERSKTIRVDVETIRNPTVKNLHH